MLRDPQKGKTNFHLDDKTVCVNVIQSMFCAGGFEVRMQSGAQ